MPKFSVIGLFTASKHLGVFEADTKEEAIELALQSNANYASLCHQCSHEIDLDEHSAHEGIAEDEDDDAEVGERG